MYGKSTSNQRIEAWWGLLRKGCTDWWIRHLKDMRDSALYNDEDVVHRECLKYCFMDIIQAELHRAAKNWNVHRIRKSNNAESPPGRPDILYFNPDSVQSQDYLIPVDADENDIAEEMFSTRPLLRGCSAEFNELVEMIMEDENLEMPRNAETLKLFILIYLKLLRPLTLSSETG